MTSAHKRNSSQLLFWLLLIVISGCGLDYDPNVDVLTGAEARQRIGKSLPDSATDFYVFDGGTFNGSIYYVSFICDTVEDCWDAVAALDAPDRDKFQPQIQSEYAVNIQGPSFYWKSQETEHWQISTDANGVSYEVAQDDSRMQFWAIDFTTKRVFSHHESGGFPVDPPSVQNRFAEK